MSFFRYPGGKTKIKDVIAEQLEKSATAGLGSVQYREPFFGGGSIGLHMVSLGVRDLWVNDRDVGISCLWTSVISHHEQLKDMVRSFTPSVGSFCDMKAELSAIDRVPEVIDGIVAVGFKKMAIHQTSYSGLGTMSGGPLGGMSQASEYKIGCRWNPKNICSKIDRIHHVLSGVKVRKESCSVHDFETLVLEGGSDVLLYIDPPYYIKGNELYQCGMTSFDHLRLSKMLRKTSHRWVLSYDDCREIRDIYSWACVREIDVNYSINANKDKDSGKRLSNRKGELIISNCEA